jgi:hypothetical protein
VATVSVACRQIFPVVLESSRPSMAMANTPSRTAPVRKRTEEAERFSFMTSRMICSIVHVLRPPRREARVINPKQPSRLPPALLTRYRRKSLDVFHGVQEDFAMANHGLLHIALLTRDLKKTEQFYTQVLGLKVAFRVPPNMVFFALRRVRT